MIQLSPPPLVRIRTPKAFNPLLGLPSAPRPSEKKGETIDAA